MVVRPLSTLAYQPCLEAMRQFTANRSADTADEIWLVQHPPTFTLGLAAKPEHLLGTGDIDVVQTERGGQVTYHGPGQLVVYTLLDLKRLALTVRGLVCLLEKAAMAYFESLGIATQLKDGAPGVYLGSMNGAANTLAGAKIAALGLKVSRGCSYHGIALNINMNLEPFSRINPCGYPGLQVVDIQSVLGTAPSLEQAANAFSDILIDLIRQHSESKR